MNETLQHDFLYETLIQFDQIIKIATIEIWQDYKQKTKQITTSNKLKAKMASLETSSASAATAQAISNATAKIANTQEQNLQTVLWLSNLEKALKRQEQKTNEVVNNLQTKNKNTPFQDLSIQTDSSQRSTKSDFPINRSYNKQRRTRDGTIIPKYSSKLLPSLQQNSTKMAPKHKRTATTKKQKATMETLRNNKIQPKQPGSISNICHTETLRSGTSLHKHNFLCLGKPPTPAMAPSPTRYQINRNNINYQQLPFATPNLNPFQSLPNTFTQQILTQRPHTTTKRNITNSDSRHFLKQKRNRPNPDV